MGNVQEQIKFFFFTYLFIYLCAFIMTFPWQVAAIAAHSSAAISLSMFVLEEWDCDKFWYVFGFCR